MTMDFEDEVMKLTRLGLNSSQAIVYLTLLMLGPSDAQTISNYSHVGRSDVYRVTSTLKDLGLAEKIISMPCKFRAVNSQDAFAALLERKIDEISDLRTLVKEICKHVENNNNGTTLNGSEPQLILMSEKVASQKRRDSLKTLKRSRDVLSPWQFFFQNVPLLLGKELDRPLQKGVEFRYIIDRPLGRRDNKLLADIIKHLTKYPNFRIRYIPSPPKHAAMLNDQEDCWIFCGAQAGRKENNELYTNNPCFASLLKHYFEILWMTVTEDKKCNND
jgi:sugar-specific transcriptional regulator TrmB